MENTCKELLDYCLRDAEWPPELLDRAIAEDEGRALLSVVVERLGDLFEPRLCDVYERLMGDVIAKVAPELVPRLREREVDAVAPKTCQKIYVLSRVTLGADVAVTSVLIDAAKLRYPGAKIFFVGPRKTYELFEADPRVRHFPAPYERGGTLRERLAASAALKFDDGIVIDPDSRLTQLGVISVCDESKYFHFESRAYGGDGMETLPALASRWAQEVFEIEDARPYLAPVPATGSPVEITVSLGVGENPAKRLNDAFERDLLRKVAATGATALVDKGGTPEERERVERVLPAGMRTHDGEFAPFAAQIMRSKLFIGYDSAGGHVASAAGVGLISIARGFVSPRMAARWRPTGTVVDGEARDLHIYIPPLTSST